MATSDVLAYVGLGLALLSYWAGTRGLVGFASASYQWAQVLACLLAGGSAVMMAFWPYAIFNAVWALIALNKLRLLRASGSPKSPGGPKRQHRVRATPEMAR